MKKGCLPVGCLIFIIAFIAISIIFVSQDPERYNTAPENKIARELGITAEQGENVIKVLSSVGISENITFEHDELLDNAHFEGEKGYRLSNRDFSNVILYMNGGRVYNVRYADNDLYIDGEVLSKITDYIVTNDEMTALQIKCQETVKSILKAPSTAKFPNILEWKFAKQDGIIIVQSYVDAENGFGAMIRSEFQFKIKDGKVVSFIMDGKEYVQE